MDAVEVKPTPEGGFPVMPALVFLQLREACGTQEEVALDLQTPRRTLGRWERGERAVPGVAAAAIRMLADKAQLRRDLTAAGLAAMKADA